jgi:radical SAM superfamily enzyme YgiQ (UPF0313 family)
MEAKKIFLISLYDTTKHEDIGISSIASYLRKKSYIVNLDIFHVDKFDYSVIDKFSPEYIGFSVYSFNQDSVFRISKEIKKKNKKIKIIVGSFYASEKYEDILNYCKEIDVVVIGEGEITMYELIDTFDKNKDLNGIKGIAYKENNVVKKNPDREFLDLTKLPAPARDIFIKYRNFIKTPIVFVQRSCLSNCSFCSIKAFWGNIRSRTLNQIVKEFEYLNSLNVKNILFLDPSLDSLGEEKLYELATELIKSGNKIGFVCHLRADSHKILTARLINTLKEAGMLAGAIGIESFNNNDLRLYGKSASENDNIAIIEKLNQNGVYPIKTCMFFNPYSTIEKLLYNKQVIEKLGIGYDYYALISSYNAYKGTAFFKKIEKDNLLIESVDNYYFNYRYKDDKITQFRHLIDEILVPYYGFDNLVYFSRRMFGLISSDFRFRFDMYSDNDAFELLLHFEDEVRKIQKELHELNMMWYQKALDDINNGLQNNEISQQLIEIITKDKLLVFKNSLNKEVNMFIYNLSKINKKYRIWVNNSISFYYDSI